MCSVCSHSVEFSCITFPINCFDFRASAVALRGNTHRDTHTKCTCVYSSASKRTLKISASFVEFALFTLRFKLALKLRIYKIRIIRRHWTRKRESETRAENGKRDNFFSSSFIYLSLLAHQREIYHIFHTNWFVSVSIQTHPPHTLYFGSHRYSHNMSSSGRNDARL